MEEKSDLVLLIDADSLIYYEASNEEFDYAKEGIDRRIKRILTENNANKYIMVLTEGKCFRHKAASVKQYKGNRISTKPIWFYALKEYLKAQYRAISIPGLEADDVVALLKNILDCNARICSPDKDVLLQIPGVHYNYQIIKSKDNPEEYYSKGLVTTTEKDAERFLYLQCLMGDSTDGIPGIEGVGPKKAEDILNKSVSSGTIISRFSIVLNAFIEKYGPIEGTHRFYETFKLVYLLRNYSDLNREGIDTELIQKIEINTIEFSEEGDSVDW